MIKAIETEYKGYRFRSRLEARWAVFFDTAGIEWQYETEGYNLKETYEGWSCPDVDIEDIGKPDSFCYLPDFYLPALKTWVEIKPKDNDGWPDKKASSKAMLLAAMTGHQVVIIKGLPGIRANDSYMGFVFSADCADSDQFFGYCLKCKALKIGFLAWAERICEDYERCGYYRKEDLSCTPLLINAVTAARSARFEHGKKGA